MSNNKIIRLANNIKKNPSYTFMRVLARFSTIRKMIVKYNSLISSRKIKKYNCLLESTKNKSYFEGVNPDHIVEELKKNGISFGLKLPADTVQRIQSYAEGAICYADRNIKNGFLLHQRELAEERLGKNILVAQYFNTTSECEDIKNLSLDPVLRGIAAKYLGTVPKFVGANLWWTFPVNASKEDRDRHAHLFHRDVDDFKFFKFFFYLTDVTDGDGAHVCVLGSQGKPPTKGFFDKWNIRRYEDREINAFYPSDKIIEICGDAGVGFAEDTWCIHKGKTPEKTPRLLLQIQYALYDYNVMHDNRNPDLMLKLS